MNEQERDEYYDEAHEADLREEMRNQLEADGPYDDFEFEEDEFY